MLPKYCMAHCLRPFVLQSLHAAHMTDPGVGH